MRALVTGCAGFIGSHLTEELLNKGYKVVGVDCFSDYYPKWIKERNIEKVLRDENFSFLQADILKLDLNSIIKDVDYVFHEAAQPGVRKSWGKEFKIYVDNNILATQRLLEACKDNKKLIKFVFASSSSVYGDSEKLPLKEDDKVRPISPYGASKLACENLCYLYWKNYGVPVVSLRYFTVFGERQRPDMAFHRFIKAILNNDEIVIYGDGSQTRDFTYVGDIVHATANAAESEAAGEIFNIGGGSKIMLKKALEIIQELIGKEAFISYTKTQKGDMKHTFADISKAKRLLDYKPEVSLKEGLEKEISWIKELMR